MKVYLAALFSLVMLIPTQAQYRITGLGFLLEPESIQSTNLGNSTVAFKGIPGTHHLNPAAIRFGQTPTLGLNIYKQDFGVGSQQNVFTNVYAGYGFGRLSVSGALKHFSVNYSGEFGEFQTDAKEYVVNGAASYSFLNGWSVGIGINYIYSNPAYISFAESLNEPEKKISVDVGVHYERSLFVSPKWTGKWSSGWSLTDFSDAVSYNEFDPGLPMPMKMNLGTGFQFQTQNQIFGMRLFESKLSIGFSKLMARQEVETGFNNNDVPIQQYTPMNPFKALFKSWDSYSWFGPEGEIESTVMEQIWTHTGIEISFLETVSLRWGYQDGGDPNEFYDFNAIGFGINLGYLQFDYMRQNLGPDNILDKKTMWQFTGRIPIKMNRPRSILNYLF